MCVVDVDCLRTEQTERWMAKAMQYFSPRLFIANWNHSFLLIVYKIHTCDGDEYVFFLFFLLYFLIDIAVSFFNDQSADVYAILVDWLNMPT